ncbi:MAG: sensor domain-containing diguanylate cyclase [Dehalococcoidia bacterium]|jgi:diguanylate cyclase (GGDEF)-like protein
MIAISKEQQMGFEALRRLARAAATSRGSREGLTHIADILRDAIGAEQTCFIYAEESEWVTCGDSRCGDDIGTGRRGFWLVQREARAQERPVAFNISEKRVGDLVNARGAKGREYIGMRIATSGSPSEMVIMRGPWQEGIPPALLTFLQAARPPLITFLERMLNATRGDRQREEMAALANAAQLLTESEDTKSVLEDLATAISSAIGFDIVTLDLRDKISHAVIFRAMNHFRWHGTSQGRQWIDMRNSSPDLVALECIRTRQPVLVPDAMNDERYDEATRKYFEWVMAVSTAAFPLTFGDEVVGNIGLASFQPRTFPPEEVEFIEGIAAQAAVALKARELYKSLAESEEQLREYSKQLQASTEIEHRLARTDALTGIPNRRYAEEVIEGECARAARHNRQLSVAILDVDGLKGVNDTQGHSAGDEVLIQLAQLARRTCRKGDAVGRYGGDEFLFVLPESGLPAATRFGERFRSKVAKHPFRLPNGKTISTTISLGVAEIDRSGNLKPSELIATADKGLYEAKASGKNRVCSLQAAERVA